MEYVSRSDEDAKIEKENMQSFSPSKLLDSSREQLFAVKALTADRYIRSDPISRTYTQLVHKIMQYRTPIHIGSFRRAKLEMLRLGAIRLLPRC